jgi:hypothetical protein
MLNQFPSIFRFLVCRVSVNIPSMPFIRNITSSKALIWHLCVTPSKTRFSATPTNHGFVIWGMHLRCVSETTLINRPVVLIRFTLSQFVYHILNEVRVLMHVSLPPHLFALVMFMWINGKRMLVDEDDLWVSLNHLESHPMFKSFPISRTPHEIPQEPRARGNVLLCRARVAYSPRKSSTCRVLKTTQKRTQIKSILEHRSDHPE